MAQGWAGGAGGGGWEAQWGVTRGGGGFARGMAREGWRVAHLLNFPLAVDGEGDNEREHEQTAQHAGCNLCAALAALTLLTTVAAKRLVQRLVALRPVDPKRVKVTGTVSPTNSTALIDKLTLFSNLV